MIQFEHVSRSFRDVQAVRDVSFEVRAGEVVGLLGPNGAGKTTALRMIATLIRPSSGMVRVGGFDVVDDPIRVRQLLGYQTTDTGLYARLTPREFLSYFGSLHDMSSARIKERSQALVREFDMESFADRPCGTLSTGQKQRVSLARTLLHDPPVVVLDEPTNGLDILSSHFVVEALRKAAADGRAVLFSSHIMSDVELASDRLVVIHQGEVVASGTIAELNAQVGEPTLSRTFLHLVRSPAHSLLSSASVPAGEPTAAASPSNPEAA